MQADHSFQVAASITRHCVVQALLPCQQYKSDYAVSPSTGGAQSPGDLCAEEPTIYGRRRCPRHAAYVRLLYTRPANFYLQTRLTTDRPKKNPQQTRVPRNRTQPPRSNPTAYESRIGIGMIGSQIRRDPCTGSQTRHIHSGTWNLPDGIRHPISSIRQFNHRSG